MHSSSFPVDVVALPNGDVLLMPAVWPVRLTAEQRETLREMLADDTLSLPA
jgi:hypothetical protein